MSKAIAVVLAILAATLVQPALFALRFLPASIIAGEPLAIFEIGMDAALYVLIVAGVVVSLPGMIVFLLLRRIGRDSGRWLALSGFALAALPVALIGWPRYDNDPGASYSSSGNWYGQPVDFVVDNVPTVYAWLSYAENIVFFGLHGLVAALVYRWAWHRIAVDGSGSASTDSGTAPGTAATTVYFNSACPVCRSGVGVQQSLMRGCEVRWVDVHREPEAVHALGLSLEEVRERLVVREADGRLHLGSDAFAALWSTTPGLRWFGRGLARGRLRRLAQPAYDVFARRLYRWNRNRGRW